jgi:hypothetical protein
VKESDLQQALGIVTGPTEPVTSQLAGSFQTVARMARFWSLVCAAMFTYSAVPWCSVMPLLTVVLMQMCTPPQILDGVANGSVVHDADATALCGATLAALASGAAPSRMAARVRATVSS